MTGGWDLTSGSFEIAATQGGAAINFTGTSSGTQTGHAATVYDVSVNANNGIPHYLVSEVQ